MNKPITTVDIVEGKKEGGGGIFFLQKNVESTKLGAEAAKKALMLSPLGLAHQLPGLYHYSLDFKGQNQIKTAEGPSLACFASILVVL